jgi:cell division topological specificity factor
MNVLNYLGFRKKTAALARDRLHIIIAQERNTETEDFLPLMRKEIMEVVAKYTKIDIDNVKVDLHVKDNSSVLELNVVLPEKETEAA